MWGTQREERIHSSEESVSEEGKRWDKQMTTVPISLCLKLCYNMEWNGEIDAHTQG